MRLNEKSKKMFQSLALSCFGLLGSVKLQYVTERKRQMAEKKFHQTLLWLKVRKATERQKNLITFYFIDLVFL